jgi:hypothetical protein
MRFCRNLLESSRIKFGSCHERRRRFEKKFINNNQKKGKSLTISRRSKQYSTQGGGGKLERKLSVRRRKCWEKFGESAVKYSKTIRNNSEENPATKSGSKSLSLSLSLAANLSKDGRRSTPVTQEQ